MCYTQKIKKSDNRQLVLIQRSLTALSRIILSDFMLMVLPKWLQAYIYIRDYATIMASFINNFGSWDLLDLVKCNN